MKIALRKRLEELKLDYNALDNMLGEVYIFPDNPSGSPTREAKEFATLLNASGRYILSIDGQGDDERAELILNVCSDPKIYSESALKNLDNHKMKIKDGLASVHTIEVKVGKKPLKHLQFLKPEGNGYCLKIDDTILGIIAGMALDQKQNGNSLRVDRQKPMVAFAEKQESVTKGKDPEVKVSTRMSRELTAKGINLGKAVGQASARVKGIGGGHEVAAGANIPKKKIAAFLKALDEEIDAQLAQFSP
jgi:RecJ-like exonuclease